MKSSSPNRPTLAVFCSGRGTNLQAIINAVRSGRIRARIGVVVSDQPRAFALTRARQAGIPTAVVLRSAFPSREAFTRGLLEAITPYRVRLVCLAGFMRVLSPEFIRRFRHRIVNVHPALLPAFPGAHAVQDALAWGAKVTGITVHLVDDEVDHGPILAQAALPIRPGETTAHLLARLHRLEHRLYPQAIQWLAERRVRVVGRRVRIRGART